MTQKEYEENKEEHLHYLARDNYPLEYPDWFGLSGIKKIGHWLHALAENKIKPITPKQQEFLTAISEIKNIKGRVTPGTGDVHKEFGVNMYLQDKLLQENWSYLYRNIRSFTRDQKSLLNKVLDCGADESLMVDKIYNLCYKPIILWDDNRSMYLEKSYIDILQKICKKLEIQFSYTDDAVLLQEKITQKTFSDIIDKLTPEQKKELEEELLKKAASLGIDVGSTSVFTLLAAGSLAGFAPYLLVTTTVGLLTGILGITLPFGIYTALTSGLSFILGPVGWIGASIFAISRYKKMNMKKLVPAIVLIHSFTLENSLKQK